jgi:hypothetical protein
LGRIAEFQQHFSQEFASRLDRSSYATIYEVG